MKDYKALFIKEDEQKNKDDKIYRLYNCMKNKNYFDCDVCKEAMDVYKTKYKIFNKMDDLWEIRSQEYYNSQEKKYEIKNKNKKILWSEETYRGDTMTSPWSIIKKVIECDEKIGKKSEIFVKRQGYKGKVSQDYFYYLYEQHFVELNNALHTIDKIDEFIELSHSDGNLIPVPLNFNVSRSGAFADYDIWNITLYFIKEYFYYKDDERNIDNAIKILLKLFQRNSMNLIDNYKALYYCMNWLDKFENFKMFLEDNYLEMYIMNFEKINSSDVKEYEIIELYKNQFSGDVFLNNGIRTLNEINNKEEVIKIVNKLCDLIIMRNARIENVKV